MGDLWPRTRREKTFNTVIFAIEICLSERDQSWRDPVEVVAVDDSSGLLCEEPV